MSGGDDLDTWLARILHRDGRVAVETLQELLATARTDRGESLARQLVHHGLLGQEDLDAYLVLWPGLDALPETVAMTAGPRSPSGQGELRRGRALDPDAGPWRPGGEVGPYTIGARLGAGGMGTVYRARHQATGTDYAIKTIAVDPESEDARRFQREGEAQAIVDAHPHVAKVHAAGQAAGRFYLVMDLAAGGDLAQRLKAAGGALAIPEAVAIARALAQALAHLHGQGVLHRDLKPSNVLFDDRDQPRLVDFGLAKVTWHGTLTETGTLMGTPAYMAPEQAAGAGHAEVGPAADVYGLGAVLYEMLAGRPPLTGQTVIELLSKLFDHDPEPPSVFRPEVAPALDQLCLRLLVKDPRQRPTAAQVVAALETVLDAPAPPDRTRFVALVAAGVTAAVVLGLGLAAAGPAEPDPPAAADPVHQDVSPVDSPQQEPQSAQESQSAQERDLDHVLSLAGIPKDQWEALRAELDEELGRLGREALGLSPDLEGKASWELLRNSPDPVRAYWAYQQFARGHGFGAFRWYELLDRLQRGDPRTTDPALARAVDEALAVALAAKEPEAIDEALKLGFRAFDPARVDRAALEQVARLVAGSTAAGGEQKAQMVRAWLALGGFGQDPAALEAHARALERDEPWARRVYAVATAFGWAAEQGDEADRRAVAQLLTAQGDGVWEGPFHYLTTRALAWMIAEGRVAPDLGPAVFAALEPSGDRVQAAGNHMLVERWYALAMAYQHGLGQVEPDADRARDLLRRAAEHAHPWARRAAE